MLLVVSACIRAAFYSRKQRANVNNILLDFRHAVRAMKKNPGFTCLALAMLGVGIGATTAIFSVFYAVLLRPLPFPEPERLVQLWETRPELNLKYTSFTEGNFWDLRDRSKSFEELAAYHDATLNMTGGENPEQVSAGVVSSGLFRVLGTKPILGRDFLPDEDQLGRQAHVVLLGDKFWRSHFGGDPKAVGQILHLSGAGFLVVGVLPAGEPWLDAADVFVPLARNPNAGHGSFEFAVVGRLRKGIASQAALAEVQTICKSLEQEYPKDDAGMGVIFAPASEWLADDDLRTKLWVLLSAVAFLLLIACVNLANLLLAKASGRTREMAVRTALGATKLRLARMVLAESVVLGLSGAVLGVFLAQFAIAAIKAAHPADIPRIDEFGINPWVLAFTLLTAVVSGLVAGLVPAWQAPAGNVVAGLRAGDRGHTGSPGQRRWRTALVTTEVAVSVLLLVGAGLLIRSFDRLLHVDRGFQSENRLLVAVNLPQAYKEHADAVAASFMARAGSIPGVLSVAELSSRPITGSDPGMGIVAAERPDGVQGRFPWAGWRIVSGDYFRAMGIPIQQGRTFTEHDRLGKPWRIMVSQRLADTLWPGQDPIGRQAVLWKGQRNAPAEVIGIVGNQRERGLEADPTLTVYLPSYGAGPGPMQFVVHTAGSPAAVAPALRSVLKEVDPNLPLADVQSMDDVIAESIAPRKFTMMLLAVFAGIALLLAMVGVYGVLAYSVALRTAEIGLRVALGASPENVLRLIVGRGMRPILLGITVGVAGSLALSRTISSLLLGIDPMDPFTYIAVALFVGITAMTASYLPARRALKVDPIAALRQE
jgi:predicted permease